MQKNTNATTVCYYTTTYMVIEAERRRTGRLVCVCVCVSLLAWWYACLMLLPFKMRSQTSFSPWLEQSVCHSDMALTFRQFLFFIQKFENVPEKLVWFLKGSSKSAILKPSSLSLFFSSYQVQLWRSFAYTLFTWNSMTSWNWVHKVSKPSLTHLKGHVFWRKYLCA